MHERYFTPPNQSFFLFGPRGTGKSTWLRHHYPNAYWIDLLLPRTFQLFAAAPELLKQTLDDQPSVKTVVIDEVQRIPELLNVIHSLIEEKRGIQFVMTGSSARKLKKHGVNLLGGRALRRNMPPFYASEISDTFNIGKNLYYGMLPLVLDSGDPSEVLAAYAGMYLKEEVQSEGIVRNVGDFARFLETMSFSHGSLINASNIARECLIARKTVDSYLLILEDLLLSFQLDVFRQKAKRSLATHKKFYFFDCGVYNSLRPKTPFDIQTEQEGPALEGLVAQHLRAWTQSQPDTILNFWRTSSQVEVDFIVSGPSTFYAIEVKNSLTVHPKDLSSLRHFVEDYPNATPIMLYRGMHRYKEGNISCIPVDEFLLGIHPQKPLPYQK